MRAQMRRTAAIARLCRREKEVAGGAAPHLAVGGSGLVTGQRLNMRDDHDTRFGKKASRPPREMRRVFVVTRGEGEAFESITGLLRAIDERYYEAVYLRNGERYLSQRCKTPEAAARHLAHKRAALEAAGWTTQAVKDPT
jgi:hypothetical protein